MSLEAVKVMVGTPLYERYRKSGVDWVEEIPEHWKWVRANYVFKPINERSKTGEEELLSVSEHKGVLPRSASNVNMFMAESYEGYKLCQPGDLVINSLWAWSRGLGFSEYHGIVSTAYSVFRPDHCRYDKRYLNYLLRTDGYVRQYLIASKGVWISRLQLSDWAFQRIEVLSPPLPEQTRIAAFLDRKCGQIDQAIAQKERLIALLKERRQVLVQQAVTKGLDPKAKMKDSGVGWLGEVPAHWEVRRLKYLVDKRISNIDKHSVDREQPVRLCNYVDVYKNDHIHEGMEFMRATATQDQIKRFRLRKGDVIITKDSEEWLDIAVPALVSYEADDLVCGYHLALLRPLGSMYGPYLHRALEVKPISLQFSLEANGVTRVGLSHSSIGNPLIPVPPMEEQMAISSYIENALVNYNAAEERMRSTIAKLKEYRSILINAAVTGKIKVPEE